MNQLETLLNTLIKMGWKPADFQGKSEIKISEDGDVVLYMNAEDVTLAIKVKLRNLVSLESGLWQFVCSHLLIGLNKNDRSKNSDIGEDGYLTADQYYEALNHQYRLIESALIPDEKLGKFLVENISTA